MCLSLFVAALCVVSKCCALGHATSQALGCIGWIPLCALDYALQHLASLGAVNSAYYKTSSCLHFKGFLTS